MFMANDPNKILDSTLKGNSEQPPIMQTQPENEIFSNRRIAKNTLVLYVRMIFMIYRAA